MPRCYMVKKTLCNKYINSVTRGFEGWSTRCKSPTPSLESQVKLPAPKPRYVSSFASNMPTKEHVPVIIAASSVLQFDSSKIITSSSAGIANDMRTSIHNPSPFGNACSNTRSPDRPPRSIEQPLAKSAFSRPKQFKSTYSCENDALSHDVFIPRSYLPSGAEIPLFRDRSAAETEAAHDLLELSRSLPPLPAPSIIIGPQTVIELPATDIHEMSVYNPAEHPIYQVNTIDLHSSNLYHSQTENQHIHTDTDPPTGVIYESTALQTHGGVFIPLAPVQEILFYSTPTITPMIAQPLQSQLHQHHLSNNNHSLIQLPSQSQSHILYQRSRIQPVVIESTSPLTPPTSECSSDVENNNPNLQKIDNDQEIQTITLTQSESKTSYACNTLFIVDGRSKHGKKFSSEQKHEQNQHQKIRQQHQQKHKTIDESENIAQPETFKLGRYICCECGKQYATSSNLSRHKQTHRSIDSQSAKKCIHCGKAYVSMPALAMHVLTHKLAHSCGICGKMFSRPWLLQGHLRSHTGEKPYGCAHCGKAFADRSNLRAHMQTHSADKNYECLRCHKTFALKSYLNKHLESACQRDNDNDSGNDLEMCIYG